jgi:p-hydroxybenzoate 3-monooxygenase
MLAHLLTRQGVDCVVLESRSRAYVERRVRAGVLEQGSVDLLRASGVGDRMDREGLVHHGVELRFDGERHRIDLFELTRGRSIMVYGQQEVVKDLIQARVAVGGPLVFEAEAVRLEHLDSTRPTVIYRHGEAEHELVADFVAGCDGFWGIARQALPAGSFTAYDREYPFAWLGILAATPPSSEELIYAYHPRGFALHSMRTPTISRLYLQCAPDEQLANWPAERIWAELQVRLGTHDGFVLQPGEILEQGVTAMRSHVVEPMQYGRLFLAGDAAHIVPPTGAKGMNLALADVRILAEALAGWYADRSAVLLEQYSATCLRRVWRAEHFSWWMTAMLHRFRAGDEVGFEEQLQLAQLRYTVSSTAAATSMAENYVGLVDV